MNSVPKLYNTSYVLPEVTDTRTKAIMNAVKDYDAQQCEVWVVLDSTNVVAAISISFLEDVVNIDYLGSTINGLGTILVNHAVHRAREKNIKHLELVSFKTARGFYERLGFTRQFLPKSKVLSSTYRMDLV